MRLFFAAGLLAALLVSGCATPPGGPDQMLADLRILSADQMKGRATGQPGAARARAYLVERFEALGLAGSPETMIHDWRLSTGRGAVEGINIVGRIEGARVPDRYIVVTAHYDHVGVVDGQIHNGADDNASGVATLLELAARLRADPPEHSVLIVALDGEELGLLGARAFVESPPVPLSAMALNLNLDMTGRPDDGRLWAVGTHQTPALRAILEPIAPVSGVSLAFGKDAPTDRGADNWVEASDHAAFHAAGIPFIYLGVDFHPDYHAPTDDFERIDPAAFLAASELSIAAFRALDAALD